MSSLHCVRRTLIIDIYQAQQSGRDLQVLVTLFLRSGKPPPQSETCHQRAQLPCGVTVTRYSLWKPIRPV